MKLTPEERAIHESWEVTANDGFIRPDVPGSRGPLTPEELAIHNREDGIVPIDDPTETPAARDRREMVEQATEAIFGEEPMPGEEGKRGWKYAGGVSAGQTFAVRNGEGVPDWCAVCPIHFNENRAYENYTLVIRRNQEGEVISIRFDVNHHQSYSSQFTPEQFGLQVPKPLRGQLTAVGKQLMEKFVQAGAMKPAPMEAPKPAMPTKPFEGFKPAKKK